MICMRSIFAERRCTSGHDILTPMNDAERYNAEFEQLVRDTQSQAEHAEKQDREAIWKGLEKSFNRLADISGWSPEKRAASKKYLLDHFWDD
jgi:hypothetical protein